MRFWNRDRLYALKLPLSEIAMDQLAWLLDVPLWAVDDVPFQVTPNEVGADPQRYTPQLQRTLDADLDWPIHVMRHNGRWTILDGVHRLLKATLEGRASISAMILSPAHYHAILEE
jgi:hypothetical protein